MTIEWQSGYTVGVKEIDEQHKNFVKIMSELYRSLIAGDSEKSIVTTLEKLLNYSIYHFGTEEKYFKKYKYPYAKEHIKEHKSLIAKIAEFQESDSSDMSKLGFDILDYLEDWLVGHIMNSDKKYEKWFNDHGLY
jgi:methyl-accepting chemotaxis protein/hemerythrin